jgi:hypothetical protein
VDSPSTKTSSPNSNEKSKTCTDPEGLVHELQGMAFTYCGWQRVWAFNEWPINTEEKLVTCLACITSRRPA